MYSVFIVFSSWEDSKAMVGENRIGTRSRNAPSGQRIPRPNEHIRQRQPHDPRFKTLK